MLSTVNSQGRRLSFLTAWAAWAGMALGSAALPTPASAQTIQWIRQFGTASHDGARGVAAHAGGVYVVGNTSLALPGQTNAGNGDAFLRRYDAAGNEVWTRQFGSVAPDEAYGIAVDSSGIYVVGYADSALVAGQPTTGFRDAFVRKYDLNGNAAWTSRFGSTESAGDVATRVAVNSTGVYVVGHTNGTLPNQTRLGPPPSNDAFIRKYDLNGTAQWTRQFGTAGFDEAYGVAVDSTGIYVAGRTNDAFPSFSNAGLFDAYLVKFDFNGAVLWTRQFGAALDDSLNAGAADATGVYFGGNAFGALPGQPSGDRADAFVRKFNAAGDVLWTRQFGGIGDQFASGVAVDSSGVYVAGHTFGTFPGQASAGFADAFFRKFDLNGGEVGTIRQFGSSLSDRTESVAVDSTGVYLAGNTDGSLPQNTSAGLFDAFAAKVSFPAGPADIIVSPQSLRFSGLVGGGSQRQALQITSNGMLDWSATVNLLNGTGWLVASPPSGTATASTPSRFTVEVNFGALATGGIYQAVIVVRDTAGGATVRVPVTVVASPPGSRLLLSQSSFVFRTVEGGAPPVRTLRIVNGGQGSMSWAIPAPATLSAPWLGISSLSGTATAGRTGASSTTLSVNTAGLSAGVYQALVPVSAPGARNDPQLASVTLHVVPAATGAAADLSAHGLVFVAGQGGAAPAAQSLTVSNDGGGSLTFQWQASTTSGGNWLSVTPTTGSTTAGPAAVQVTANPTGLAGGIYRGKITGTFTPGGTQEVEVVLAISTDPIVPQRGLVEAAACAASSMEMVVNSIGAGSVVPVSFPRPLVATVVDSCGAALSDATVSATVEGRNIALEPLGEGLFTATWTPERQSGSIPISFAAQHPTYPTVQRTVAVSAAAAAGGVILPILFPNGVVEGAAFTSRQPLAPGGIVSLFGSSFAPSDRASTQLPLARDLDGVRVRIGGEDAPLYFAGAGQINAQVPYSVQTGNDVPVVVSINGRLTAPQTYQIAPAQPGIFLAGDGGAILDGQSRLVNAANPARRGDVLQIFSTGLGETDPPAQTGQGAPSFSRVLLPVTVTVGGVEAPVQYQGLAPGFVGLYQVNVQLPTTVAPGDNVEVVIRQNGISSNPERPAKIPVR